MMRRFEFIRNEAGEGGGDGGGGGADAGSTPQPAPAAGSPAPANLLGLDVSQGATATQSTGGQTAGTPQGQGGGEGFSFGSLLGADGQFVQDYAARLTKAHPDLAQGAEILSRIKDPVSMAKMLIHNKQLATRKLDGIESILNVDPSDEQGMALKREKLGIPTHATGYELKFPEKLPDGTPVRKELVGSNEDLGEFAQFAFENDIPKAMAQKLVEFDALRATRAMTAAETNAQQAADAQLAKDAAALKSELGSDYTRKMDLLVRLLEKGGMTREQIRSTSALRDLDVTKALINLAAESGDDRLPASTTQSSGLDAGAAAKDIINNPQNPLNKAYWDGDQTANQKVQALLKQEADAKRALASR